MRVFENLGKKKVVLGMVHLGALPGTPFFAESSYEAVRDKAVRDALAWIGCSPSTSRTR
jgi:predicted TIM-barrel enzyme